MLHELHELGELDELGELSQNDKLHGGEYKLDDRRTSWITKKTSRMGGNISWRATRAAPRWSS